MHGMKKKNQSEEVFEDIEANRLESASTLGDKNVNVYLLLL